MRAERKLLKQAYTAWEREQWLPAARHLEALLAKHPDSRLSKGWWFDAALAYKHLRDWPKAFELGKQAAARAPRGEQDPAFWNLGIAATVLGQWAVARDAWAGYGIPVEQGDNEIDMDFGTACVRLDPAGAAEVVWGKRICPTRIRVLNVPVFADRRFGDVVLHDGAPNGTRVVGENSAPVFDEITVLHRSELAPLTAMITAPDQADVHDLADRFSARDLGLEADSSTQMLCSCCSTGEVHQEHTVHAGEQKMWLAAPEPAARELLDGWQAAAPGRAWRDLRPAG